MEDSEKKAEDFILELSRGLDLFRFVFGVVSSLSVFNSFVTPWTIAHQDPLAMEFSRQEYWNGLPFLSTGDPPNPGIEPMSPAEISCIAGRFFTSEPPGKLNL